MNVTYTTVFSDSERAEIARHHDEMEGKPYDGRLANEHECRAYINAARWLYGHHSKRSAERQARKNRGEE